MFPHEMAIDRSKLESAGIKCFTKDEFMAQVHNFYSNAIGGVKLQVFAADLPEAKRLLELQIVQEERNAESSFMCPFCGSSNFDTPKLNAKLSLLSTMLLGVPLPIPNSKLLCLKCNRYFKAKRKKN